MTKVKTKNEQGITLVALIITIIVLIILAAVSIVHMLNLQIIGQAVNGTQDYSAAQYDEKNEMVNIANMLESTIAGVKNNQGGVKDPQDPDPETPPDTPSFPLTTDADIGKYVDYTPTAGSYTAESRYSGYTSNQTFSTETDMKWRIWKVDSDNLYLISDRTTRKGGGNNNVGELYLESALGYNNGVTLLDNICSRCYSNSSYSEMTARSIKIGDIEGVTTYDYTSYENYNESPNTSSGSYPYIWGQYESTSIENRSTAYGLTTETYKSEQTFTPLGSFWQKNYSAENATTEWNNSKYYDLLDGSNYWMASRNVLTQVSGVFRFGLMTYSSNRVDEYTLWFSNSNNTQGNKHVRPFVSIPVTSCTISDSTDSNYDYHIAPKA